MKIKKEDYRIVDILVSPDKDIAIFPLSIATYPLKMADGTPMYDATVESFPPIEIKFPYTVDDVAKGIELGIDLFDKQKCFEGLKDEKISVEEVYYKAKSFRKATKGCRRIEAGWSIIRGGKFVSIELPGKFRYNYYAVDAILLPEDADWIDFAAEVIRYINADVESFKLYDSYKKKLNI